MSSGHPAMPPPVSIPWLIAAGASGLAAWVAGWPRVGLFLGAALVLGLAIAGRPLASAIVGIITIGSFLVSAPLPPLPPGRIEGSGVMASDVIEGRYGPHALIDLDGGTVLAHLPHDSAASRGDLVHLEGTARGEPGMLSGRRHRGTVNVGEFEKVAGPVSPVLRIGNAMRDRVLDRLSPLEGGRALLAGFMVGDTSGVGEVDEAAMRKAGLSHFTAVSGSNVALFLGLLYAVAGPVGVGPKRRALLGLFAIPIFAAATRFEPSVLRASLMAGLALGGRLLGVSLEAWQLLSAAVIGLLLFDPLLVRSVGFQLSVAATAGVIAGSRWPLARRGPMRALAVTIGAQTAVAPLLLVHFGLVPLLSPLANLLAAPLVAASTLLGAVGVIGPGFVADVGAWIAGGVMWLASLASSWPQIGWLGVGIVLAAALLHLRVPRLRGLISLTGAGLIALLLVGPIRPAPEVGAVVLDVGQGDAILLSGGEERFALIDGGPDPVALVEALAGYGVQSLQLVVVSHVHADHVTGLGGVVGRIPVGEVWASPDPHRTPAWDDLHRLVEETGVELSQPELGETFQLGELTLTVEAPLRRYASPNDQSIVVTIGGPTRTMLLSGDIETIAQRELGHVRADVLKVPHQGAATSDPDWLRSVGADLAVISVGPNDFGHPADWVIKTLVDSGATVVRTDTAGDVAVPLG